MNNQNDHIRREVVYQMVSEDARWFADIVLSNSNAKNSWAIIWSLLPHACRIQYEGYDVITSKDPLFSHNDLAGNWETSHWRPVERMRHFSKLMDKKRYPLDAVLESIKNTQDNLSEQFLDTYPSGQKWKRRLTGDISIMLTGNHLLGTSTMAMERYGITWTAADSHSGEIFRAASESWGKNISTLCTLDGRTLDPSGNEISMPRTKEIDRRADVYLTSRYGPGLDREEALLISAIEGDLNASRFMIDQGGANHRGAKFRAQYITLFHSLKTLQGIVSREKSQIGSRPPALREFLERANLSLFMGSPGRQLRNRCFHYQINDADIRLDPKSPLFGILEHVGLECDFDEIESLTREVTGDLAETLSSLRNDGGSGRMKGAFEKLFRAGAS